MKGMNFNASAGVIHRDTRSKWIFGFGRNIGVCSIVKAELWGAWVGLMLAWGKGFRNVILEMDDKTAVDMISKQVVMVNDYYGLLASIKELLSREWNVKIKYVYKKSNRCADKLTNFASNLPLGGHFFQIQYQICHLSLMI